jgi:hypothetical protein
MKDQQFEIDGGLQLNGELQDHHVWTRIETVITAADLWTYMLREFVMPDPYRNPPDKGNVFTDTRAVVSEYFLPFDELRYIPTAVPNPKYDPKATKNPANPLYDKSKISPYIEKDASGLELAGVYPRRTIGVKVDGVTTGFNEKGELVAYSGGYPLCNPLGGIVNTSDGLTILYGPGLNIVEDEATGLGVLIASVDGQTVGYNTQGQLVAYSSGYPLCNPVGGIVYIEEGLTIAYGGGLGIAVDEDTGIGLLTANVDWETIGINAAGQMVAAPPVCNPLGGIVNIGGEDVENPGLTIFYGPGLGIIQDETTGLGMLIVSVDGQTIGFNEAGQIYCASPILCNPMGGIVYTTDGLTIFAGAGLGIVQEEETQLGMLIVSTDGETIGFNEQGQLTVGQDVMGDITSALESISDITSDIAEITGNVADILTGLAAVETGLGTMAAGAGVGVGAALAGLGSLLSAFTSTDSDGNVTIDTQKIKKIAQRLDKLEEDVEDIADDIQSLEQFCYAAQIVIGDHATRIEALETSIGSFTVQMADIMAYVYDVYQHALNMQRHLVSNVKMIKAVFRAIASRLAIIETQIANAETVDYIWQAIGNLQRHTITNARTSEKRLRAIEERVLKTEERALKVERENRRLRKMLNLH